MASVVSTRQCLSAGSILLESRSSSSGLLRPSEQYDSGATVLLFNTEFAVLTNSGTIHIPPAAPFDSPSVAPVFSPGSSGSQPTQPRKNIFIQDLGDPQLSLNRSVPIALDFWYDSVTACCHDLEDFGVGQDEFSAVADLKASLVDLYFLLKNDADRLGPLPQRHWNYLQSIITEH